MLERSDFNERHNKYKMLNNNVARSTTVLESEYVK